MSCELKSDVKLTSNIIRYRQKGLIGRYIPVDLIGPEFLDARLRHNLTSAQQTQYYKSLFYANEVRDTDVRFFDLPENKDMCKDCPYRDICY